MGLNFSHILFTFYKLSIHIITCNQTKTAQDWQILSTAVHAHVRKLMSKMMSAENPLSLLPPLSFPLLPLNSYFSSVLYLSLRLMVTEGKQ